MRRYEAWIPPRFVPRFRSVPGRTACGLAVRPDGPASAVLPGVGQRSTEEKLSTWIQVTGLDACGP